MATFVSKQLKYFMVAMELKSITKAAETLFITRTPLSKILTDLETFLGEKLFIRQYNTLMPTQLAWELYYDLLPIYEAHQKVENKIKRYENFKTIKLVFDVSFPETLYKIVVAIFSSGNEHAQVVCEKETVTDQYLEKNKYNSGLVILSLRKLTPIVHYEHAAWEGSEVTLIKQKNSITEIPPQKIFLWRDMFSSFFEEKILDRVKDRFESIEIIKHNYDFSTLLYKIQQGEGAVIMPGKIACIYKTDNLNLIPLKGAPLKVNLYHNLDDKFQSTLQSIKKTLRQLI